MPVLADLFLRDGQKSANLYMHHISQGLHITHLDIRDNLVSHINAADSFAEVQLLTELLLDGKQLSHTVEDTAAPPSSTSSTWSSSAWPATPSSPWATRRCWVGASSRGAPSSHYWSLPAGLDSLAPPALLARDIGHHFTVAVVEEVATAPHPLSPPWPP